jgi:transporter family protein
MTQAIRVIFKQYGVQGIDLRHKECEIEMWIAYAFGSAFFAGITSILAKCGIKKTDSNVATAIRTVIVLLFSWFMVFVVGSQNTLFNISIKTLVFLILSGIATGASWLCYFKALQLGNINKIVPIDKSSTILTILLAVIFLRESISIIKAVGIVLIGAGTYLMVQRKDVTDNNQNNGWLIYALLSAFFASLTAILAKIGISGIESNLGTAIRTIVVLIMAWIVVFATGKWNTIKTVPKNELSFICLSGFATGASWLCYYKALKDGLASVVVPIDKLSILIAILFSYIVFKEKLSKKAAVGLIMIVIGTLAMILK